MLFGGILSLASATSLSCCTSIGFNRKATAYSPLSTALSNALLPSVPSMKLKRLSVRKSYMPKIGLKMLLERIAVSSFSTLWFLLKLDS